MRRTPGSIVIAGAVARRPGRGGHAWAFLQYILGFRRLGWDVTWLDSIDPPASAASSADVRRRVTQIREFERFSTFAGIEEDASLLVGATGKRPRGPGGSAAGLSRGEVLDRLGSADLFINVMGYVRDEELLAAPTKRLFLDIDPGFPQMWEDLGLAAVFHGHDAYATVGGRIGVADCPIPTLDIPWIRTVPPVVLEAFDPSRAAPPSAPWTSVCSWRGPFEPVEHGGQSYGLRVHEFRRFLDLPGRTDAGFVLALDIDDSDAADRERLIASGWGLADPRECAGGPARYRRFIRDSAGEFMIAKGLYVQARSGWFSDRSVCYLASGRPVVAQDTGWMELFPAGEGLLGFEDPEGAVAAIEAVRSDPSRHGRAARQVAEASFDSDQVLGRLAERALSSTPAPRAGLAVSSTPAVR